MGQSVRESVEKLKETVFTDSQHHTDFIASFFQLVSIFFVSHLYWGIGIER